MALQEVNVLALTVESQLETLLDYEGVGATVSFLVVISFSTTYACFELDLILTVIFILANANTYATILFCNFKQC